MMAAIAPPGGQPHLLEALILVGLIRERGEPLNWKDMQLLACKNNIRHLERALFSAIAVGMIDVQFSLPDRNTSDE